MVESIVVDANPILSALLGGTAREVIFSGRFLCYSTQHTLFEVVKYLPMLARRLGSREADLFQEFQLLPIVACQPKQYEQCFEEARKLIAHRDPKDVPILALALALQCPLWTQDRDFDGISAVAVRRTSDLLAML